MQTLQATPPSPVATGVAPPAGRVAIVHATWHEDIVGKARDSMLEELMRQGVSRDRIDVVAVPGAFEIPLLVKRLASARRHAAIMACALVVDGGIYRHEFVAASVLNGLMSVQLETDVPVFSCVLTPHQFHDHAVHHGFFAAHFVEKGREVASACLQTLRMHRQLGA